MGGGGGGEELDAIPIPYSSWKGGHSPFFFLKLSVAIAVYSFIANFDLLTTCLCVAMATP